MKNKLYIFIVGTMLFLLGCQTPDDLIPSTATNGITSISAFFTDEDGNILDENNGKFTATVTDGSYDIVIPVSYYYPENSDDLVTEQMLVNMRVEAVLGDNVMISPSLLYLDLSSGKKYTFTVVDQMKQVHEYTIRAEITKSAACAIEEFNLPGFSISGVINESNKTISLVSADDLTSELAEFKLSPHATISPDPSATPLNYNEEQIFTVTAHNGTTQATYTVKKSMPDKISSGIRPGSAKILFAKKLIAELGAPVSNHGGIAATQDYVVISTRDNHSIVLHPKTGALLNPLDVSATGGGLNNMYNTADDGGNVLICNLAQNAGTFKIWKVKSLTSTPELFINWTENTTLNVGRKFSVQGNIDENAIIAAPILSGTANSFARWKITDGVLQSHTPDIVSVSGLSWTTNVDVVYTSATNVNSDYFIARHGNVGGNEGVTYSFLNWINGATNTERKHLTTANDAWGNFIANALDYTVFNNIPYALINYVNATTWGQCDQVYLVNAGSVNEFEAPSPYGNNDNISGALIWQDGLSGGYSKYNHTAAGVSAHNGNGTGDVAFVQSADGFFLYVYFMFTNGYIVGVQFDCIDM
ncbi:MAG TPA: DUF5018 domain-containing protein [Porphyromonadaceae bacterium]|nr:DUF5018 domain-containing protein [Porphyromonadaceae bacterium]HBX45880.1 DUF5018 domain-containing protein [Porphyromonadaceae bacterium]